MLETVVYGGTLAVAAACGAYELQRRLGASDGKSSEMRQKIAIDYFRVAHSEFLVPNANEAAAIQEINIVDTRRLAVSFDLFDTLVSRDVPTSDAIFDVVETRSGFVGFADARKTAEKTFCNPRCLGNINDIYKHIPGPKGDMEAIRKLQEIEWNAELEHAVLIQSNVDKLKSYFEVEATGAPNVIIVVDSYYNAEKIRELLKHLDFPYLDKIAIFASRDGKKEGWVWSILNEVYDIQLHIGDNYYTDTNTTAIKKFIKKTCHSQKAHQAIAGESLMFRFGEVELGSMIRRLSLANPYAFENDREMYFWFRVHAAYTIPLMWYFTKSIEKVLLANPSLTHVAAMSRNCILLAPLIARFVLHDRGVLITPEGEERPVTLTLVEVSDAILSAPTIKPNYLKYLKGALGGETMGTSTLVIDINGTYKPLSDVTKKYFGGAVPRAHFLSIQNGGSVPSGLRGILTPAIPGIDSDIVQRMNTVPCGSLVDWFGDSEAVRAVCEHDDRSIEVARVMFTEEAPRVLDLFKNMTLPRSRVMSALMQKAWSSIGSELKGVCIPPALSGLMYQRGTEDFSRRVELATLFARLLSPYHDVSRKTPLQILGNPEFLSQIPWDQYMNKRAVISPNGRVASASPSLAILNEKDLSAIGDWLDKVDTLAVYIADKNITPPPLDNAKLKACWDLPSTEGKIWVLTK